MANVKRFTRKHNDVRYFGTEDRQNKVTGSITKGDKKWTLTGFPKINRTYGSYKHGNEVQIIIWNRAGTTFEKDRVPYAKNWDTVEIFFSPELWLELVREYFKYIKEVEQEL